MYRNIFVYFPFVQVFLCPTFLLHNAVVYVQLMKFLPASERGFNSRSVTRNCLLNHFGLSAISTTYHTVYFYWYIVIRYISLSQDAFMIDITKKNDNAGKMGVTHPMYNQVMYTRKKNSLYSWLVFDKYLLYRFHKIVKNNRLRRVLNVLYIIRSEGVSNRNLSHWLKIIYFNFDTKIFHFLLK